MSRARYSVNAMIADQWYRNYLRHLDRSIARENGYCELCQESRAAATPPVTDSNVDAGDALSDVPTPLVCSQCWNKLTSASDALSDVPTPLPSDAERRARLDRWSDSFGGPINVDAADLWCPDSPDSIAGQNFSGSTGERSMDASWERVLTHKAEEIYKSVKALRTYKYTKLDSTVSPESSFVYLLEMLAPYAGGESLRFLLSRGDAIPKRYASATINTGLSFADSDRTSLYIADVRDRNNQYLRHLKGFLNIAREIVDDLGVEQEIAVAIDYVSNQLEGFEFPPPGLGIFNRMGIAPQLDVDDLFLPVNDAEPPPTTDTDTEDTVEDPAEMVSLPYTSHVSEGVKSFNSAKKSPGPCIPGASQDAVNFDKRAGRYALADSVSNSTRPSWMSRALVNTFMKSPIGDWKSWIRGIHTKYQKAMAAYARGNLQFWITTQYANGRGCSSTFFGLEFNRDGTWKLSFLSDSRFVRIRNGEIDVSHGDRHHGRIPNQVGPSRRHDIGDLQVATGDVQPGDTFILMSDALGDWLESHSRAGFLEQALAQLEAIETEADFQDFVNRSERDLHQPLRLKKDDQSFIMIDGQTAVDAITETGTDTQPPSTPQQPAPDPQQQQPVETPPADTQPQPDPQRPQGTPEGAAALDALFDDFFEQMERDRRVRERRRRRTERTRE